MLSLKLVRAIESHWEPLAKGLLERLKDDGRCAELVRKVPPSELEARTVEIYRNLGAWLEHNSEDEIRDRYLTIGASRRSQGVALAPLVWGFVLTKDHLRRYVRREGMSDLAVELYGELELVELLDRFFDRALFHAVVGWEQEDARTPEKLARSGIQA